MIRVVVLLGAPASGKTTVGEALHAAGLRWRDWESWILDRWNSRDQFLDVKAQALPVLHAETRDWINSGETTAVIETTGLSDEPLIRSLVDGGETLVIRLDVTEGEASRRAAERKQGSHLTDDAELTRRTWNAFYKEVAPRTDIDVVIDTEATPVNEIVELVLQRIARPQPRSGG